MSRSAARSVPSGNVHEFLPDGPPAGASAPDGGTLMLDYVEFTAPFGVLGRLVEKAFLSRYMQHLIEERNRYLQG